MDSMILAAGLGTRLGAITRTIPKALVPIGGVAMLERVARSLIAAGADRLIINAHHHADQIVDFIAARGGFGVSVEISREVDRPLETGGGLLAAKRHFRSRAPFFLHNVDILTDLPLADLHAAHTAAGPLATLAVSERESRRYLLFDADGLLGRVDETRRIRIEARPARGEVMALAFGGIHVIEPAIFDLMGDRSGVFSILDVYLDAVREGAVVLPYLTRDTHWVDIGRPERLEEAERVAREIDEGPLAP